MRMKPISNKDKQIIKRIMKHKKQILLSFIILFMAVVLIDVSPYGGQNLQLYAKWIECGHKPYKSTSFLNPTRSLTIHSSILQCFCHLGMPVKGFAHLMKLNWPDTRLVQISIFI